MDQKENAIKRRRSRHTQRRRTACAECARVCIGAAGGGDEQSGAEPNRVKLGEFNDNNSRVAYRIV